MFLLAADPDPQTETRLMYEVGNRALEDPRAVSVFTDFLTNGRNAFVRQDAALWLAHVRGYSEVDNYLEQVAAKDAEPDVR